VRRCTLFAVAFDLESGGFVKGVTFGVLSLKDGEFVVEVDECFTKERAEVSLDPP